MATSLVGMIEKVNIPITEYEALVRDSECLEILRDLYTQDSFFNEATVKVILGIEPAKENKEKEGK